MVLFVVLASILLVLMIVLGVLVVAAIKEEKKGKKETKEETDDGWKEKNDFVNLLYEKGYLTDDERRCLLLSCSYNGSRYIIVSDGAASFRDSIMDDRPFLAIYKKESNKELYISVIKNRNVADVSIVKY
jgi:hypothetical protein